MKGSTTNYIEVSKQLVDQINSRSSVSNLLQDAHNADHAVIDFKNISFISRSAAHQLLTEIEILQNKGVDITFSNLGPELEAMLDQVSSSRKTNYKRATFVKRRSFASEQEFEDFLLAI